jgi:hypothetical protein
VHAQLDVARFGFGGMQAIHAHDERSRVQRTKHARSRDAGEHSTAKLNRKAAADD